MQRRPIPATREAGKTRPQRRLLGTQPKNSGFGLSPIQGKLFPRFETTPPPNWKGRRGLRPLSTRWGLRVDREHTRVILEAGTLRQGQGAETKNLTKILKTKQKTSVHLNRLVSTAFTKFVKSVSPEVPWRQVLFLGISECTFPHLNFPHY